MLLEKLVDPDDKIYLRAITGTPSSPTSYTRTIELPAIDHNPITDPKGNPAVRVVPYPDSSKGENFTIQQFKDFMADINGPGITKFDLNNFQGIEIMKDNHLGNSNGSFLDLENLKSRIENNNIFGWFDGKSVQIDIDPTTIHYDIINGYVKPYDGWIVIEPYKEINNNPDQLGGTYYYPVSSYLSNAALIKLKSTDINPVDYTIAHEFGHASRVADGEANKDVLHYPLTVMEYLSITPNEPGVSPGAADLKAARLINEETYQPEEKLDDILGMDF
jgi:hypothetical protein